MLIVCGREMNIGKLIEETPVDNLATIVAKLVKDGYKIQGDKKELVKSTNKYVFLSKGDDYLVFDRRERKPVLVYQQGIYYTISGKSNEFVEEKGREIKKIRELYQTA